VECRLPIPFHEQNAEALAAQARGWRADAVATRSRINTVIAAVITSNLALADAPGNVRIPARVTGLKKSSVINVSQIITVDKSYLTERVGTLKAKYMKEVDDGLRLVLAL